jgi:DNA-directed RNA polymerase subunit omega
MNMIDPPIGELLAKVDCRYTLAVEASKRARELISGVSPLVETRETKPLAVAIDEIQKGLVTYIRGEAASDSLEEAQ